MGAKADWELIILTETVLLSDLCVLGPGEQTVKYPNCSSVLTRSCYLQQRYTCFRKDFLMSATYADVALLVHSQQSRPNLHVADICCFGNFIC